ncbi:MAG: helix-turn-helix transcriptional regulator [Actinomycetota bacterium]|nr:helix-turn-helix transcriptional regulator [Actinomycetota bacterium]
MMTRIAGPVHPRARELGDLLRSRRERLQPAEVGLPASRRRRTPGLRREEVALLAAISPTYYAFLEQGRDVRPSRQVLDSLARALRLSVADRTHLHDLVHGDPTPFAPVERLSPAVAALVERLDPCPTYVTGRRFDVLVANRAARALWTDWNALDAEARNILSWMFTDPLARSVFVEWEAEASAQLARFRASSDRHPDDPGFRALIDRLHHASPEFRDWWPRHKIAPLSSGTKRLRHPVLGELELHHVVLQIADDPEQKVVTFAPSDTDRVRIEHLLADTPPGSR